MSETAIPPALRSRWWARAHLLARGARRALRHRLSGLEHGQIVLVEGEQESCFGRADGDGLRARVVVHDPAFYVRVAFGGNIGAGESYMDGAWSCDDLTALSRILIRNQAVMGSLDRGRARAARWFYMLQHWRRRNPRNDRRNVADHYDLGNDFFALFLDPSLTYSAGIFEQPDASMEKASLAKYERICRKLDLSAGDRVLEIGSGWGGFAMHAARHHGCRVTTITLSQQQWELASQRVAEAGLADRVEVLLEDYRSVSGTYDKLVSIEMIEAVGHRYYEDYFRTCSARLAAEGRMLLQCIVVPDQRYEWSRRSVDFIKRYIFPGGGLPSVKAITDICSRATDFRLVHLEDITSHYARTLRHWRRRMHENLDEIRRLGYPERFLRMWEFYLCSCEGAFDERYVGDVQILLEKPLCRQAPVLGALPAP